MTPALKYVVPLLGLGIAAVRIAPSTAEPGLPAQDTTGRRRAAIASVMETMAANGQFSGTVLVAVGGERARRGEEAPP